MSRSVAPSQPTARGGRGILPQLLAMAVAGMLGTMPLAAQTGAITGTITDARSGAPLTAAQVSVEGTGLGARTQPNGRFLIPKVPAGTHTVNAVLIGYASTSMKVTVTLGGSATADMKMTPQAVSLSEIVTTGVVSATQRAKLPFDVSQVRAADIPVPQPTVATALAGKVAGVAVVAGNSRPGQEPDILLRGPTTIDPSGKGEQPLFIVDGVILGSSPGDIDALDIESIDIAKGAAAASLYGSRGAAGVIRITTKRGSSMPNDVVHYTLRTELGRDQIGATPPAYLATHHPYAVDSNGLFIDLQGNHCEYLLCRSPLAYANNAMWYDSAYDATNNIGAPWTTVSSVPWPGQTYDQVGRFVTPTLYMQNYAAVEGRSGGTSFHGSVSNLHEGGVMPGNVPFNRTNLRLNVDQTVSDKVQVQASGFYSRSAEPTSNGDVHALARIPAGSDLLAPDPNDSTQMVLQVDPNNAQLANPIYALENATNTSNRGRFLGSVNVRYSPTTWLDVDANGSYDRLDTDDLSLYPRGYRTTTVNALVNNGNINQSRIRTEASNASITATVRRDLNPEVHSTTTVRYLYEKDQERDSTASGYDFAAGSTQTLANANPATVTIGSVRQSTRVDGYLLDEALDLYDKYELDALVRTDAGSLFSPDQRRQWYYRVAGAWRLTQEPWFHVNGLNELKLRYSLGTAGERWWYAQRERHSVVGGVVMPVDTGRTKLKPESSTQQEAGIDAAVWNNRVTLNLTYAHTTTKDQLLYVPLPIFGGISYEYRNAGTLTDRSYEATVDVDLIRRDDFDWSVEALFSRNTSEITALNAPPYVYGVDGGAGLGSIFYARPGEKLGTFYGEKAARSCADLPSAVQDKCGEFTVNDDGFLVWVGQGGKLSDDKWGTASDVLVRGAPVMWGTVFAGECTDRTTNERTLYCPLGNSLPKYDLSFQTNLRYKGIDLHALVTHSSGFSIYDRALQWAVFAGTAGIFDQAGIPAAQQKPIQYFLQEYAGLGGLAPSGAFVEDGTFTKLKEISLSYRFNATQLAGVPGLRWFNAVGLTLDGQNLWTSTSYRGFDPEVGRSAAGTASAALVRVESDEFPPFRTFSATVELIF